MLYKYPKETLAPAQDIDEAWHAHILFTKQYTEHTKHIFGNYLHHTPATGSSQKEKEKMHKALSRAEEIYFKEFKQRYFLELDVASFW